MNALALGEAFSGQPSGTADAVPTDWLDVLPPQADCLRDYQRTQLQRLAVAMRMGYRHPMVWLPTGGGKTHLIAAIVAAAVAAHLPVLILATRTRLIRQLHDRLKAFDLRHGVIAAPLPELRDFSALVQLASVDTLHRRAVVNERHPLPPARVVIFDEGHLATADTRLQLLDSFPAALRIGFTATPARKSGKSLGAAFDCIVPGPSIRKLTADGILVPTRIFSTPLMTQAELRALPKDVDNDFSTASLGEVLGRPKLVGDVVENWLRIASGKRTLCFAVSKAHAASLLDSFRRQGVAAELLIDQDDEPTREEVIARLEAGSTKVVINCFLMSYGIDVPCVECIVLARPTRSLTMYLQMVGRGLRAAPGKSCCLVIDHGHVVENLGLPQSDHAWTLDQKRNVGAEALKRHGRRSAEEKLRTCPQCTALWLTSEDGNACPSCGWVPVPRAKPIDVTEADLEELADPDGRSDPNDRRVLQFYREACGWQARRKPDRWVEKPKSLRWAAWKETQAKFKIPEAMGKPGAFWDAEPVPASAEVAGWLQYRVIKWARSRAKAAA